MANENIQPDMLSALEKEMTFIESQSSTKSRRVKIPKGHLWRVRFLPVQQGETKMWWGRYLFHWLANRPYLCPKTPVEFGGHGEQARCPLCETADRLNHDRDQFVSRTGYRAMAVPQWLLYCLVISKDNGETEILSKEPDLWAPWEFWLTKTSMADIMQLYKQYLRRGDSRGVDYSFLDLIDGCTVAVKNKKNGLRFTPERPGPFFEPSRYDEVVERIWSQIRFPNNKPPSEQELRIMAQKLEETAYSGTEEEADLRQDKGYGEVRKMPPFERDGRRGMDEDDEDDQEYRPVRKSEVARGYGDWKERSPAPGRREPSGAERGYDTRHERQAQTARSGRPDFDGSAVQDEEEYDGPTNPEGRDYEDEAPETSTVRPMRPERPERPERSVHFEREEQAEPSKPFPRPVKPSEVKPQRPLSKVPPPPARPASSINDDEDSVVEETVDPAPPKPVEDLPEVSSQGAPPPAAVKSLSERLRNGISAAAKR